jgi:hypothetical protein
MPVSMGGQQAFQERCKRIARNEGRTTLFIGMTETSVLGDRHRRGSGQGGAISRFGLLGVVLLMPAAAYSQGLVDISPEEAMNLINRLMDAAWDFATA